MFSSMHAFLPCSTKRDVRQNVKEWNPPFQLFLYNKVWDSRYAQHVILCYLSQTGSQQHETCTFDVNYMASHFDSLILRIWIILSTIQFLLVKKKTLVKIAIFGICKNISTSNDSCYQNVLTLRFN